MKTINNCIHFGLKMILYFTMVLIIAVFIWSRVDMVPTHFTHYDDLYAPYLFTVIDQYDPLFFSSQLEKYGGLFGGILSSFVFDFFTEYPALFSFLKRILAPLAIAKTSTFAPLQFYLTSLTIDYDTSYTISKITFRLPSAIFSLLTIFVLYRYSRKINNSESIYILLIGSLIFSVSWMFLIYSSQGENFAAAVFSLMTLIYIFEHYKNSEAPIGTSLKVGVFVSFLCLLHYQTMFFLPGFFIALFYESSYSIRIFSKKWIPSILVAATTVLGIYFIFLKGRLTYNPGIHWNAGESGQYAFNPDCGDGFFGCAFRVFIENLFEVMQSIVSFSNIDETTSLIYTTVILALTVLGFIYIISNKRHRGLFIFLLVGVIVWMALVLMNKLTFSPTRHSLILLSPIALLSSYGFYLIFRNFTKILTSYFSVVLFCIIVLSLFVIAFDEQKEKRGDPLEKVKIENILQKYNPSVIIAYSNSAHLEFYPIVKNNYWSKYMNNYPYSTIYKKRVNNENKSRILIFCVNGELCNNSDSEVVSAILMKYFGKNKAYENIYKYEVNSTVLNGFGSKAGSGPNSLFLSIWE